MLYLVVVIVTYLTFGCSICHIPLTCFYFCGEWYRCIRGTVLPLHSSSLDVTVGSILSGPSELILYACKTGLYIIIYHSCFNLYSTASVCFIHIYKIMEDFFASKIYDVKCLLYLKICVVYLVMG
jgi:hypothetical protein